MAMNAAEDDLTIALECFPVTTAPPSLVSANQMRPWMDAFPGKHAYRCLPMNIANSYGWIVECPCALAIGWNGGPEKEDLRVRALDDFPHLDHFVTSNFSMGIVTFHVGYLFRTPPGRQLIATGPFNAPKHGIAPLTGVIESDWLPYPFTMNWQMTAPGVVRFEKGEPFCQIFPVRDGAIEQVTPIIRSLDEDPDLKSQYEAWRDRRSEFLARLTEGDPVALKEAWQRFYFRGEMPDGRAAAMPHKHKLRPAMPSRDSEGQG